MMKKILLGMASMLFISNSYAAIMTTDLGNVDILGTTYYVQFIQDDQGYDANSYNAINPGLTFTTEADAAAAVNAILAATDASFDFTPAAWSDYNSFRVAYAATATTYDYLTGGYEFPSPAGPFVGYDANGGNLFSFAVFSAARDVPAPASLALLGLGLIGVSFSRRRKAA